MNDFFRNKRLVFCLSCTAVLICFIVFSYGRLAVMPSGSVAVSAVQPERGAIVDRNGLPLAVQTTFYHIGVNLPQLNERGRINRGNYREKFAADMAAVLGMDAEEVMDVISAPDRKFVYLRKKVDKSVYDDVRRVLSENGYTFVTMDGVPGRIYPSHSLASQLIGYMGSDGRGLAGIEYSQQEILSPSVPDGSGSTAGKNVFLSIDANLQYKLEQVAAESMESTQAESFMLIAADSRTGEILSYISLPSADLNDYGSASEESKIDRPAMSAYEPGSVFKIFTVGIVHDERGISPNDSFLCDGSYERKIPGGETIRIKCLDRHGWLTPRDALRFSCNDVIGQISDRISDDEFIGRIRQLGFGSRTGVELPGETTGSVKSTGSRSWSARSKPTIAIGQEISVSALQMVQAATAVANGGIPVKLTFINRITDRDGTVVSEHVPQYRDRVFSKASADYVLSCMETTARTGTGSRANLTDVSIGVKTGTAQMADSASGGYSSTDFLSNCIAIFPVNEPQIILYIVIQKAKGETYAGRIVAPVIARTADIIIDHLGMSRGGAASLEHNGLITISGSGEISVGDTVPDFSGRSKKELLPLLERQDIRLSINGSGWVTSQNPPPGTPLTRDTVIELNLE